MGSDPDDRNPDSPRPTDDHNAGDWANTTLLTEAEMAAFEAHCDSHLGARERVLHEIVSETVHLDVLPYPPTAARPWFTLVTMGASALPMTLPDDVSEDTPRRIELMISLPPDWFRLTGDGSADLSFTDDEWAPGGAMKSLARYVHESMTWFGPGHTIAWNFDDGHPLANFKGFALAYPDSLPEAFHFHHRPDGETVAILALHPLYKDELAHKQARGFDSLLRYWARAGLSDPVVVGRPSVLGHKRFWDRFTS